MSPLTGHCTLLDATTRVTDRTRMITQCWGDAIGPTHERSMRLYFQNINGLHTTELREQWLDILHVMESLDVDLYGLAETNINWNPSVTNFLYQ